MDQDSVKIVGAWLAGQAVVTQADDVPQRECSMEERHSSAMTITKMLDSAPAPDDIDRAFLAECIAACVECAQA